VRYAFLLPVLALAPLAGADDRTREEAERAEKFCADELPHWKLSADGVNLENPKESVLRWTNPFVGRTYGNTYVWLQKGRPVAVGCLFHNVHPWGSYNAELAALTGTKLVAKRDDKVKWEPTEIWKWSPVPGAPAPAATAGQRLVQLRALASEFVVELVDTRNKSGGEDQTPRLLPKPLYRYDAELAKTLDGALFAYVLGTDPELLLLIECDTAAEKPQWRFGVTRMNRDAVRLKHKGETVWEAAATKTHGPTDSYLFLDLGRPKKEPKEPKEPKELKP
jgi:hypothetical protein